MIRKKDAIDSINVLLEECIMAYPVSAFVISLYKQYQQRGSLSKKQLEGLYSKASKIKDLAPGKLAAVEVIIKKMPTRDKTPISEPKPMYEKDESVINSINHILAKYPEHKRVLFLKSKYENNEILSATDLTDLNRMEKLINKD